MPIPRALLLLLVVILAACAGPGDLPSPIVAPPAGASAAAAVYQQVSPAVAFIETADSTGSGALLLDRYVITNAHVVWPYTRVRVVFPDGAEFADASVRGWDLTADLALIGPLDTAITPLPLADGEDLPIGSELYLIGYPDEYEAFPQPAMTRGILSRLRQWQTGSITYVQTDAAIAGGQSGGVLVTERGNIIGISGFMYGDSFALVASMADMVDRLQALAGGKSADPAPTQPPARRFQGTLDNVWSTAVYRIVAPPDTTVDIEVASDADLKYTVLDIDGDPTLEVDDVISGAEQGAVTLTPDYAPYFLVIEQFDETRSRFTVQASADLIPFPDAEDGRAAVWDDWLAGTIDYPGDYDYHTLTLHAGDLVQIDVDSLQIDSFVQIFFLNEWENYQAWNDDDGSGIYGENARLIYQAPADGEYVITVSAYSYGGDIPVGGYFLRLTTAPPGSEPAPYGPPGEEEEEGSDEAHTRPARGQQ